MNKDQVKQFLKQKQIHPLKKWGQNFLINQHIIQKIIQRVQNHPPPFVEIGPGLGALSQHFANRKKDIILIERDKKLFSYWKEAGWSVFHADALKFKWEKLPKQITVFGNLPYEIASSLIIKSSLQRKQIPNMVFMMQKEVAQRVRAQPYNKDYGLLSVISQTFWNTFTVANALKADFYPRPKVEGRVLEFQAKKQEDYLEADLFLKFVKQCFSFRRKMLFKQIEANSFKTSKTILKNLGLSENCRAEELDPKQFAVLYLQVKASSRS